MSQYNNPIPSPGAGLRPEDFVGRKELIKKLKQAMAQRTNISLQGERRIGKTAVFEFLASARFAEKYQLPSNQIALYINFQPWGGATEEDIWRYIADGMTKRFENTTEHEGVKKRLAPALSKQGNAADAFNALKATLKYLEEHEQQVCWLLDEFEQTVANPHLTDIFFDRLRGIALSNRNFSYIIATRTGMTNLQSPYTKITSPFFNIFEDEYLECFPESEARTLLAHYLPPDDPRKPQLNTLLTTMLYERTGYHPYFLQLLCRHLYENISPDGQLDEIGRAKALERFEDQARPHFEFYWELSHDVQRESSENSKPLSMPQEQDLMRRLAAGEPINWTEEDSYAVNKLRRRGLLINGADNRPRLFSSDFAAWIVKYDPEANHLEICRSIYVKVQQALLQEKWRKALQLLIELKQRDSSYRADEVANFKEQALHGKSNQEVEQAYEKVEQALVEQRWQAALDGVVKVEQLTPNYREITKLRHQAELGKAYQAAQQAVVAKQWTNALNHLAEVEKLASNYEDAADFRKQAQLGQAYQDAEQALRKQCWQTALDNVVKIEQLSPNDPGLSKLQQQAELGLHYEAAEQALTAERWQDALNSIAEVEKRDPNYREVKQLRQQAELGLWYQIAEQAMANKQWQTAIDNLEKVIAIAPQHKNAPALLQKARWHLRVKRYWWAILAAVVLLIACPLLYNGLGFAYPSTITPTVTLTATVTLTPPLSVPTPQISEIYIQGGHDQWLPNATTSFWIIPSYPDTAIQPGYAWFVTDGEILSGAETSRITYRVPESPGVYTVTLEVGYVNWKAVRKRVVTVTDSTPTTTATPTTTPTRGPTPTQTVAPTITPTPQFPGPALLAPEEGTVFGSLDDIILRWEWYRQLQPEDIFTVSLWRSGEAPQIYQVLRSTTITLNMSGRASGTYYWGVRVNRQLEAGSWQALTDRSENYFEWVLIPEDPPSTPPEDRPPPP